MSLPYTISDKQLQVLKAAISEFGEIHQQNVAIEEMGECIQALMKLRRQDVPKPENDKAVISEIADLAIVVAQLSLMYNIQDEIDSKIARLETRL